MDSNSFERFGLQALKMAEFFLEDKDLARLVVEQAFQMLPIAIQSQDKRIYHDLKTRRRKTVFREHEFFQLLVLEYGCRHEMAQEDQDPGLRNQRLFIKRFLKQIILRSMPHTSFYVAVGLFKLVFLSTNGETLDLFGQIIEDKEHKRDESAVSRAKRYLFQDLQKRFEGQIAEERGPKGEIRFTPVENPLAWKSLVDQCLQWLTPWDSRCPEEGRQWGPKEIDRFHRLVHPPCLAQLMGDDVWDRLCLPKLGVSMKEDGDNNEVQNERKWLRDLYERYKSTNLLKREAFFEAITIIVDGHKRAEHPLTAGQAFRVPLADGDRVLEVWGLSGEDRYPLLWELLPAPGEPEAQCKSTLEMDLHGQGRLQFCLAPGTGLVHTLIAEKQSIKEFFRGLRALFVPKPFLRMAWSLTFFLILIFLAWLPLRHYEIRFRRIETFRSGQHDGSLKRKEQAQRQIVAQAHLDYARALVEQLGRLGQVWAQDEWESARIYDPAGDPFSEVERHMALQAPAVADPLALRAWQEREQVLRQAISSAYRDYAFFLYVEFAGKRDLDAKRVLEDGLPYHRQNAKLLELLVMVCERLGQEQDQQIYQDMRNGLP